MLQTIPRLSAKILKITLNLKLATEMGLRSLIEAALQTLEMKEIILEFILESI